jgi:hypothetical protein
MISLGLKPTSSGLDMSDYREIAESDPTLALAGLRIEIEVLANVIGAASVIATDFLDWLRWGFDDNWVPNPTSPWGRLPTCGPIVNRSIRAQPGHLLRIPPQEPYYRTVTSFHIRRLPHYDHINHPTFLTWRLAGTLPPSRMFSPETTSGAAFLAMDRLLDNARTGVLCTCASPKSPPW